VRGGRPLFRLSLAATLLLWLVMSLWSMPRLEAIGGGRIFDLRFFGYDRQDAEVLLAALGPEGRGFYADVQQALDTVFPALLALTLVLWFRRTAGRGWVRPLSALTLLAAALDYAENSLVRGMLVSGTAEGVEWASRLTQAKSAAGAVVLAAAAGLLAVAAFRLFRGRT